MTEAEQIKHDTIALDNLLADHILNSPIELDLESIEKQKTEQVFNDINRYTNFYIPTSNSGNNKLYNLYIRKFLTKRVQQIFNSPKVIIYAQVPQKLQGVMFSFSPSKYRKAVKHLFDRVRTAHFSYES
jgi:hypothetical protein